MAGGDRRRCGVRERVTADELMTAIRDAGATEFAAASMVILESNGSLTAVLQPNQDKREA